MSSHVESPWPGTNYTPTLNAVSMVGGMTRRNRIINGDARIDQPWAGNNPFVSAAGVWCLDKWRGDAAAAAGVFSVQRSTTTPPAGFSHCIKCTTTTADAAQAVASAYILSQTIEGSYCYDLEFGTASSKSVTLSFWFRSSLNGPFSGSIRNGANNRGWPFSFAYALPGQWVKISTTIPVDVAGVWATGTTAGLIVTFDLGNGNNLRSTAATWQAAGYVGVTGTTRMISTLAATCEFAGVQLEPGIAATEFERTPLPLELMLCQREYYKTFRPATAPVQAAGVSTGEIQQTVGRAGALTCYLIHRYPVQMRTVPLFTFYNPVTATALVRNIDAALDCGAPAAINAFEDSVTLQFTGNAAGAVGQIHGVHMVADCRL